MHSTEELMKELKYFYEPIPHIYGDGAVYIYLKDGVWQVLKKTPNGFNTELETKNYMDILVFLIDNKVDLSVFDSLMVGCIKTRYIYLKSQAKKIEKLLGTEAVVKAEEDWEDFRLNLIKTVKRSTSGFTVIEGDKK